MLILGLVMAFPTLNSPDDAQPPAREGDVGSMEVMRHAKQPMWLTFVNPFVGAFGVLLGARLKRARAET